MSDSQLDPERWNDLVAEWNEQFFDAMEGNLNAQAEFVERWAEAVGDAAEDPAVAEGAEGYARAYETWMDASAQMVERLNDAVEGEEVEVEEFRDVWLQTANQAFKEIMSTSAFARMTGETVDEAMAIRQAADETAESTLHGMGFATEGDVAEVGDRLVELERRQHAVERKLDRVIAAIETDEAETDAGNATDRDDA